MSKTYRLGTHRTKAPEATIARVQPLLERFGITRVANLTGLDRIGLPVVMVCRPNARSSAVFHGKGIDVAAAKASGVMEAIETWHAEQVSPPLRFGSVDELSATLNLADAGSLARAPGGPLARYRPLLWVEGQDLLAGAPAWVPFEIVHANSSVDGPPASGSFAADTNGLASGNHALEALSHALCEVIERDATSLWHRKSVSAIDWTRVDLGSVRDPPCRAVLDRLAQAQLDAGVWETTTDVGVPAYQCLLVDRTGATGHVGAGSGCHPAREIALVRALTEAAQVRTTYIVGSREDITYADYAPETLASRNLSARALMRPVGEMLDFEAGDRHDFQSFDGEVAWILDRLRKAGLRQAIAVDLTKPELGIPVVRVVVPGLEGSNHHAGYVPGARAQAIGGPPK